ncbi:MAG: TatD family hydrolase [Candidatus Wildermuthbacteria bacterium]|nr:TatD family hydrolase [Candidatus Wildermuthbacteria bacterium]
MLIDTHGHVSFNAFKEDSDAVLKRAIESDTWVVMPGTQFSTSQRAVEMAEKYGKEVYAAIGLHPIHLEEREVDVMEVQSETLRQAQGEKSWMIFQTRSEEFDYEKYKRLALSEAANGRPSRRVVAIGECGLDYYYEPKGKEKREALRNRQKSTLALQVKLAEELGVPVIFHCRKAHDDLIEFLANYKLKTKNYKLQGVVHCYTGTLAQAEKFYAMGLYFGFNGLIFKKVPALPNPEEIIKNIPLERIVLETDSPYLVPPQAGVERNEPVFVKYVAEEIARIKDISFDEVASATTANAKSLFKLGEA